MSAMCDDKLDYRTECFITRANEKHGYRFDYSQTVYVKSSQRVTIRCPDHGLFEQLPRNHLRGSGCPFCSAEYSAEKGAEVGKTKRHIGDQRSFFEPGTLVKLPFWD